MDEKIVDSGATRWNRRGFHHGLRRSSGRWLLPLPAVALFLFLCGDGCYHYRITSKGTPATDYPQKTTVHALFWGLVQDSIHASDCASGAVDEVRVTSNLGYSLIAVLTLGIWSPMQVEWRCAKQLDNPEGVIGSDDSLNVAPEDTTGVPSH